MKKEIKLELPKKVKILGISGSPRKKGNTSAMVKYCLKSAETMKAAVAHLEPHMDRAEGQTRGYSNSFMAWNAPTPGSPCPDGSQIVFHGFPLE